MSFLRYPYLDLTTSRIKTERCILVPFSFDAGVDIHEFHREFSLANQDLYVAPSIPTYDEEVIFLRGSIEKIGK
jgi:hypothetical protein